MAWLNTPPKARHGQSAVVAKPLQRLEFCILKRGRPWTMCVLSDTVRRL